MLTHPFLTRFFAEAACVIGEKLLDFNFWTLVVLCSTINFFDIIGTPFVFVSVPCSDWSRCCAVIDCRVVMMPERAIRRIVERSHSLPYRAMPFFLQLLGLVRSDAWCILVIFGPFLGARVDEAALLRCCFVASY